MLATQTKQGSWRNRFGSSGESRQQRRTDSGTNSGRQRSRYHDEGPLTIAPPSADDILRVSRRTATEVRQYEIGDTVPVVIRTSVVELTITGMWTNGRGEWCCDVAERYGRSYYRQSELWSQQLPADYVAAQLVAERDQINALKRGSRRRDTRRIN